MMSSNAQISNNINKMRKSKKDIVIKLLKKETDGLTTVEIASKLKIARNTVAVALAELKGQGALRIRPVGIAKLHYLKK
jgi:DNA-binding transcriptional regulator YhcF (GntR family)